AGLSRFNPVDFVVKPLSTRHVEARVATLRHAAGVGTLALSDARQMYQRLRDNVWLAMLADQDARRHGVFVPFLGIPASTAAGPARIAIATGSPIVTGFALRRPDGRHEIEIDPPLEAEDARAPDAAERLTALHVARLERRV